MFIILLYIAVICFLAFIGVYGLYFMLVIKTSKKKQYLETIEEALNGDLRDEDLPTISVLVPAYNEEEVISRKLQNIASLYYPRRRIEVIVLDDCSTDKTAEIARRSFEELNLPGRIIRSSKNIGVNAFYNRGVAESTGDLLLMTDADVTFDADALMKGVKVFKYLKDVGGVTGRMVTVSEGTTSAVLIEKSYRNFYDSSLTAESAIYSTFPGYTCYTLLKRSAFSPLPEKYGSSDGNISLATIRRGLKFIMVPDILFYEPIAVKVAEQKRQKIRRAARLIQSTMANKDMMFKSKYESFSRVVFPLKFAMLTLCPAFLLVGLAAFFLFIFSLSVLLGFAAVCLSCLFLFVGTRTRLAVLNLPASFFVHQFYLLSALAFSGREFRSWRVIERH